MSTASYGQTENTFRMTACDVLSGGKGFSAVAVAACSLSSGAV